MLLLLAMLCAGRSLVRNARVQWRVLESKVFAEIRSDMLCSADQDRGGTHSTRTRVLYKDKGSMFTTPTETWNIAISYSVFSARRHVTQL